MNIAKKRNFLTIKTWISLFVFFCSFSNLTWADETVKIPTIRSISVVIRDVFDPKDKGILYQTANKLKINTKEDIVRRELLFKEGDLYDKFVISESGRNLRSLPFLRNISITETREGNAVDIVVSVQDTWTFFPVFTFSSGSGTSSRSAGLVEGNLAGYGKRAELLIAEDESRRKYEAVWDDRRFLGTLQRFSVGYFQRSDGNSGIVSWGLPFRSLVNKEAWFIDAGDSDLVQRLFRNADERFVYREKNVSLMGGYTIAAGDPTKLLNRLTFGYSFKDEDFSEATASDFNDIGLNPSTLPLGDGTLASDRRFSGPVFSWQLIKPEFISLNYIDLFDRVQDFNLGNEIVTNFQIAPEALGSLDNAFIYRLTDTNGYKISPQEFLRGQIAVSGRFQGSEAREVIISAQARHYHVHGPQYLSDVYVGQHTLASSATLDAGFHLDQDTEFLLGASNGLRGYEDRTFSGQHKLNINLEDRVHLADGVAKLVSVGMAAFADIGAVSNNNLKEVVTGDIYADVGIGLRLGLLRSSGGSVVRIDLAVPLRDGPDGSAKFEPRLLFTTGQLFSAFLRSDAPGLSAPSISAGFAGR